MSKPAKIWWAIIGALVLIGLALSPDRSKPAAPTAPTDPGLADAIAECGEPPEKPGYKGRMHSLAAVLKDLAHDPDSLEVFGCEEAIRAPGLCWTWTCNVRAKNAFGAKVLNRLHFSYAHGRVSQVTEEEYAGARAKITPSEAVPPSAR